MNCPLTYREFQKSVNMTPAQIRAWAKDPRSRLASFPATRKRLPALAALKALPPSRWTAKDCKRAQRIVNFNRRMSGNVRAHGCRTKNVISMRNWGRAEPGCPLPKRSGR